MRRFSALFCMALILFCLAGCSSSGPAGFSATNNSAGVPVSLSMTDDPPQGVSVLFFQISLTAASLTPASGGSSISLLNNNTPIQIDVTQLQALSAFLSTANVPAGSYSGMTLTFANPQLVIFNESDQALAGTCALNTVCQVTPQLDGSATVTFSSAPFPVAISQNTPLGFLLQFHLNMVIQPDLSVNLGVTNGVTVKQLPPVPMPIPGPPQFGFLVGTIQNVNSGSNTFTLQTRWGHTFTIDANSSTTFDNFPSSACSTSGFACLASGQVVKVQIASVQSDGSLLAGDVSYVQAATQQVVQGNILKLATSNGNTLMTLLLRWSPDATMLPFGGMATVTVPAGATFAVDSGSFTIPSGLSFASASDLLVGQTVQVNVTAGSVVGMSTMGRWEPPQVSFTASAVQLEPSQITGTITAISGSNFTMTTFPNFFGWWMSPSWTGTQITVQTTSQTNYLGAATSFSSLQTNNTVSVGGWLYATPSGATPSTQVAQRVLERSADPF